MHSRPGLVLGSYPEYSTEDSSWFEKLLSSTSLRLNASKEFSQKNLDQIVKRIDETGESLKKMPDEVLDMSITGLKLRLARSDADIGLAIQAFAMIREVADRVLGLRHFPTQLKGGWVIYNGLLAEMQTGEGKTLTATLPASTAAMSGIPVHVITSNDYLAKRDAETMQPVYQRLGLSVGHVIEGMDISERTAAYACDITYCTNKQIAFDYLRDRVARGNSGSVTHLKLQRLYDMEQDKTSLLLRGLCFAIVDEADSVLIDEARTPLILSNPVDSGENPDTYRESLRLASKLSQDVDFIIHKKERTAEITHRGSEKLKLLAESLDPIWKATRRREELVSQALVAQYIFVRDRHYLVKDNKVQIIDDYTGRLMPDRSWARNLHQMVEMKEGCEISNDKETLARISYQSFFRRYLKVGGMTGTAIGIEKELALVYRLPVIRIPTHKPCIRKTMSPRTFTKAKHKNKAIVTSVNSLIAAGRPVLIGTRSVEMSERISIMLNKLGVSTQILNARQDAVEAEIIANAGAPGVVTVATNMAGRGTDIKLTKLARDNGGLHVIVTERNEADRIDRQLIGRCSRQGDPGSYQIISAMEDEIPAAYYSEFTCYFLKLFMSWRGEFLPFFGNGLMNRAQSSMEYRHAQARRALEKQEERLGEMLAFSGSGE
jgi:preprotein translocase subunit SecA